MMMKYFFTCLVFWALCSCSAPAAETDTNKDEKSTESNRFPTLGTDALSIETIETEHGWGYHILKDGRPFIRQYNIPSIPGNQGFDTAEKAEKAARFIMDKINRGQMPPSTNRAELDSLGLL
jgi:hypothetical protein